MNINNSEKILNFVKYAPILFIIVLVFTITEIILYSKERSFNEEIKRLETTYLEQNKSRVKEEVQKVYNSIVEEKKLIEQKLKKEIKNRVYEAHNLATNLYNYELKLKRDELIDTEHVRKSITNALSSFIFNQGRGYFFIVDADGTNLLQPLNKELEGQNLLNMEDKMGYKFVKKIVKTTKEKSENYDTYYWYKNGDISQSYKKISFYKYFEPLNASIGTGEYIVAFENELKQRLLEKIRKIRYGKDGYIFIYDSKGKCLSHYKKDLIGLNRLDFKDKNGKETVKELVTFAKEMSDTFMVYDATIQPSSVFNSSRKISFIKTYEPWDWIIGTGFYLEDLNNEIQLKKQNLLKEKEEDIRNILIASVLLSIFFITISFLISKSLKRIFRRYEDDIKKQTQSLIENEKILTQQSKMAAMGEMIGNIAHQWRQPLSLIRTISTGIKLENEMKTLKCESLDESMLKIDEAVKYLSNTIDDFRDFYSPKTEKSSFYIVDVLERAINLTESKSNNKIRITLNVSKETQDLKVLSYENHLVQCIINILNNAKDELMKNSNEIKAILISIKKEGSNLQIVIKDNAGGIAENIIDRIFEPYFTTKHKSKGTGIGLYMTKQIISKHLSGDIKVNNCDVYCNSKKFTGAQFTITIPV